MIPLLSEYPLYFIAGAVIWLWTLIAHLRRTDCSDTDRIVWTIVLCTLNILGVVLYWTLGPKKQPNIRSEAELKAFFNSRRQ